MVALRIEDLKRFTSELFVGEAFDRFMVKEAEIVTYNRFTIDGHIRRGYYSSEEMEEGQIGELSEWSSLRPYCFSLIKGRRLPQRFSVVLKLPPQDTRSLLQRSKVQVRAEDVEGLYLNVRYENGALSCMTGTSLKIFVMDHSLDYIWDDAVRLFLRNNRIIFQEGTA